ncbi:MAG: hypothetical protein J1G04_04635 [Clostridiales bacterium]|nr:hypothetical protein [Clostridiales bacterium]
MWYNDCVMYQIYPIGFCGVPRVNGGEELHKFGLIEDMIPHLSNMGVNAVMLNPVLKSSTHGYDTIDFYEIDNRLGTRDEYKSLIAKFHAAGIKVMYDAVYNHVGRDFPQFKDVCENKGNSRYKDWFYIDFNGNSRYNDGFSYADWHGCAELVKLNLDNPEVLDMLFDATRYWIREYGIDGLRLDAASCLPKWFFGRLKSVCNETKQDFPLVAEIVRLSDLYDVVAQGGLDGLTNYECFTGMISSVNQPNFFEIAHSIERNFGANGMFRDKKLLSFVDNHDVKRAATAIKDGRNLPLLYALMFAMPGTPCIYYGSEFAATGDNAHGDEHLRPCYADIDKSDVRVLETVKVLSALRKIHRDMIDGMYERVYLSNTAYAFYRGNVLFAFNVADSEVEITVREKTIKIPAHGFIIKNNDTTLAIG